MIDETFEGVQSLSGTVERVVFANMSNGFTVLELNCDGESVTAVGSLPEIAVGEQLELTGKWDTHNMFGRQFKISDCKRNLPETTAGLFAYLSGGAIKGIGPKLAAKIIERFGENTAFIISCDPEKLAVIKGITASKAVEISRAYNNQTTMIALLSELHEYGISQRECADIYKLYGVGAAEVVKLNPYVLCSSVQGFSFERVDEMAAKMPVRTDEVNRCRAGIMHVVRHNLGNGHTCLPRRKLIFPCMNLLGCTDADVDIAVDSLIDSGKLAQEFLDDEQYVFMPEMYFAETAIAKRMKTIIRFPPGTIPTIDEDISNIEKLNGIEYDEKQKNAIRIAAERGLLILTGGPGTGKTTAVKGIINIFEKRSFETLLAAPTGRAAKRLSELTGREAKTIHRLLEVEWNDEDKPIFRRDAQNPLECGAIIIDEMSMVDVTLFASLLEALPMSARLILVGDSDQLPSVGPGNVLKDLINSELLPTVCLTEIFRQAQESLIVTNAHRIISGEQPILDCKNGDFFFLEENNPVAAAKTITDLISRRLPAAYGYSPVNDIQLLCPAHKGDCGTTNLNRALQNILNPKDETKNEAVTVGNRVFREGDKIMQIKNNYNITWEKNGEEGVGVFNGDVGVIQKINYAEGIMRINFDERITEYPIDNLSELELAYAVTVHKSQGSEFDAVIIAVGDAPVQLLYRNLLYTAVTRAKKLLIVVGGRDKLQRMLDNNNTNNRYSALKSFIIHNDG